MQNLRPSNIKVIFQRPSCGSSIAVASGFIAGTAPVVCPIDGPQHRRAVGLLPSSRSRGQKISIDSSALLAGD